MDDFAFQIQDFFYGVDIQHLCLFWKCFYGKNKVILRISSFLCFVFIKYKYWRRCTKELFKLRKQKLALVYHIVWDLLLIAIVQTQSSWKQTKIVFISLFAQSAYVYHRYVSVFVVCIISVVFHSVQI